MRNLHNIDKSSFRRGQYVGYGGGQVWRIKRSWHGWSASTSGYSMIYGATLEALSLKLDACDKHSTPFDTPQKEVLNK